MKLMSLFSDYQKLVLPMAFVFKCTSDHIILRIILKDHKVST